MIFKFFRKLGKMILASILFITLVYSFAAVGRLIWTTGTLRPQSQNTGYLDNTLSSDNDGNNDGDNIVPKKLSNDGDNDGDNIVPKKLSNDGDNDGDNIVPKKLSNDGDNIDFSKIKDKEEEKTFKGPFPYSVERYPLWKRLWNYAYGYVSTHPYEVARFSIQVMALVYRKQADHIRMERNRRADEELGRLVADQLRRERTDHETRINKLFAKFEIEREQLESEQRDLNYVMQTADETMRLGPGNEDIIAAGFSSESLSKSAKRSAKRRLTAAMNRCEEASNNLKEESEASAPSQLERNKFEMAIERYRRVAEGERNKPNLDTVVIWVFFVVDLVKIWKSK